jgi:hypothetical protein
VVRLTARSICEGWAIYEWRPALARAMNGETQGLPLCQASGHRPVLLMDHVPVELPELTEHGLLLDVREVP